MTRSGRHRLRNRDRLPQSATARRRWFVRALTAGAVGLLVAGCGEGGSSSPSTSAKPTHHYSRKVIDEALAMARVACAAPRKQIAHDFGMSTTAPDALARRYARGYDSNFREQVRLACWATILKHR